MAETSSLVLSVDVQRLGLRLQVSIVGNDGPSAGLVLARTAAAFVTAVGELGAGQNSVEGGAGLKGLEGHLAAIRRQLERDLDSRLAAIAPINFPS